RGRAHGCGRQQPPHRCAQHAGSSTSGRHMTFLTPEDDHLTPRARAASIRLAVFDVDGVMTDGKLYLGPDGSETKTMHIHDGLGLKRLAAAGVEIAVISGR